MNLKTQYQKEIVPKLKEKFNYDNIFLIPKIRKVVINVGFGRHNKDKAYIENVEKTLIRITGQKPVFTKAKKSIAGFKLREGQAIGCKVTLRGERMYEFLDKLVNVALPRVKDFRGLPRNGFDGQGNYNFGLNEQLMFPEVVYDNIIQTHGMNISIATSTSVDSESFRLLELLGVPFTKGRA